MGIRIFKTFLPLNQDSKKNPEMFLDEQKIITLISNFLRKIQMGIFYVFDDMRLQSSKR